MRGFSILIGSWQEDEESSGSPKRLKGGFFLPSAMRLSARSSSLRAKYLGRKSLGKDSGFTPMKNGTLSESSCVVGVFKKDLILLSVFLSAGVGAANALKTHTTAKTTAVKAALIFILEGDASDGRLSSLIFPDEYISASW